MAKEKNLQWKENMKCGKSDGILDKVVREGHIEKMTCE